MKHSEFEKNRATGELRNPASMQAKQFGDPRIWPEIFQKYRMEKNELKAAFALVKFF